jgi:anti-sigma regulatory factor (Ser/Thr protein kinase)
MNEQRLNISFEADFKNVDTARTTIMDRCRDFFNESGVESIIDDFCLAATEAMNNAVEHSGAKQIEVELLLNNKLALLRIITEGKKFDPTQGVSMPDFDNDGDLPEGGFGMAIISRLVDNMDYEYISGKNVLTLKKELSNKG